MLKLNTPARVQSGQIPLAKFTASPLILAHGGAGPQDPKGERFLAARRFLMASIKAAQDLKFAPEITAAVANALEGDPQFNAGLGASIQADGIARVSASFMDSRQQKFSAVINVEELVHPSILALHLQRSRFPVLDSFGGSELKRKMGLPSQSLATPERLRSWLAHKRSLLTEGQPAGKSGTIGCVALDQDGHLAALTSTGGVGNETPGRVGDSPTIAGNFCTTKVAVSCTGFGEQIVAHALSPRIAIYFEAHHDLKLAMTQAFAEAKEKEYEFAAIAVAIDNERGMAHWAAGSVNAELLWGSSVSE